MRVFTLTYWRRVLAKEWFPVLISLLLAIVLWFNVGGEETVDTNVMIPVEVINLPRELVISNQFKKEIEVTVNGPRSLILEISNRKITRQIDLSTATPGTTVITNDTESIALPGGITILRVQPSSIILSLDKLVQKQFPVNPVTAGEPAPGYILKSLRMDPEFIAVTGPETVLAQHDVFRTKVININGLRASVQQQIPLDLEPAIVDLIGQTTITADISIGLEVVEKEFLLPFKKPVVGAERTVKSVKVRASIPKLLIEQNVPVRKLLTPTVMEDWESGIGTVQIIQSDELELPVEIIRVEPAIIDIPVQPAQPDLEGVEPRLEAEKVPEQQAGADTTQN
jgi:hypothetical protein